MTDSAREGKPLSTEGQALLTRLSALVSEPGRRIFAVMDGARFENLAALLHHADVSFRPLYRHTGDNFSVVQGGPWMVDFSGAAVAGDPADFAAEGDDIGDDTDEALQARANAFAASMRAALDAGDPTGGGMLAGDQTVQIDDIIARLRLIVELADGKSAAVFWIGDETLTSETLYRHLRGINRIFVPQQRAAAIPEKTGEDYPELAAAGEEEPVRAQDTDAYEMVIFRHADPNVMMQILPTLDGGQAARLFGPADLMFFAPDAIFGGGVKRARRPEDVLAPNGSLRFSGETVGAVTSARQLAERRRIAAYLRKVLPEAQNHQSDDVLHADVQRALSSARGYGVTRHDALCRWSYLHVMSNGAINDDPKIRQFMTSEKSHHTPDHRVRQILQAVIHGVKAQA